MAVVSHTFGEFLIKIGAGADALECGFKSKDWKISGDIVETLFPDCTTPDAVAWPSRTVRSLSFTASGSGVTDSGTSFEQMRAFTMNAVSVACKIYPVGASGGYFSGNFVASEFGNSAQHGEKTTFAFSIQSDGAVTWTAGS